MSANIIYPNIKGSGEEQLKQIRSYLYQLAEQLNHALSATADGAVLNAAPQIGSGGGTDGRNAEETFNRIKALIIKSADIVNAYYDVISRRLSGIYVSQSDFGTFSELMENEIEATANLLSSVMTDIQTIDGEIDAIKDTTAYFKAGMLEPDVYGVEIGRTTVVDGDTVFSRYARFLPNRLSFYDSAGNELAYFSDYTLHVNGIEMNTAAIGGYKMATNDGLMFVWEG